MSLLVCSDPPFSHHEYGVVWHATSNATPNWLLAQQSRDHQKKHGSGNLVSGLVQAYQIILSHHCVMVQKYSSVVMQDQEQILLTCCYLELGFGCGEGTMARATAGRTILKKHLFVNLCPRLSPSTAAWGCPSHLAPRSFLGRARSIHLKPILIDFETFNLTGTNTDSVKWITYRYRCRFFPPIGITYRYQFW